MTGEFVPMPVKQAVGLAAFGFLASWAVLDWVLSPLFGLLWKVLP